jgi:thioredoxin reductase
VYAKNKNGFELAVGLKVWSDDVVLYTDGVNKFKPREKEELAANNIEVNYQKIERLEGKKGILQKIIMQNGEEHECDAIFFVNGYAQQCDLVETFECEISKQGKVLTNQYQQTNTPGLYVAGDADKDMNFVVVAAAEGAKAGVIINKELTKERSRQLLKQATTATEINS